MCEPGEHLTERTLVAMDGRAVLRRSSLDMTADRLPTRALEARIGDERERWQRKLQHCPENAQRAPRHAPPHARNVGIPPRRGNAAPARRAARRRDAAPCSVVRPECWRGETDAPRWRTAGTTSGSVR